MQTKIRAAGDGEQNALCAFHGGLEQRGVDCLLSGIERTVVTACRADAHESGAGIGHDGADVGKVDVNHARDGNQVRNTLDTVVEDLIGCAECLDDGQLFATELHQAVVRDNDERVTDVAQLLDARHCLAGTACALELEWTGNNADGQRPHLFRDGSNDRSGAGTSAATLAGGDEDHVRAFQGILNLSLVVFCGGLANLRVSARAETAGGFAADIELGVSIRENQRLGVGVNRDELNALQTFFDHAVHGVNAAAADTDDLDFREVIAS